MKRKPTANPSSLFLLELIFAILFFSVASAVCVQVFVKSHTLSTEAHDLTQASRRAEDVAELITASTSLDDMKKSSGRYLQRFGGKSRQRISRSSMILILLPVLRRRLPGSYPEPGR